MAVVLGLLALALLDPSGAWPLVKLTDEQSSSKGAVCLDGTAPNLVQSFNARLIPV